MIKTPVNIVNSGNTLMLLAVKIEELGLRRGVFFLRLPASELALLVQVGMNFNFLLK